MTIWNGLFVRKHASAVEYTPERPLVENEKWQQVGSSKAGYFIVYFDKHQGSPESGHGGDNYYIYPAEPEQVDSYFDGGLDPTIFYRF